MRIQKDNLSLPAAAATAPYLRAKLSSAGKAEVSDALDLDIGVFAQRALAADEMVAIAPINSTGSLRFIASAAITVGASVYGAAGGKVAAIVNANPIGYAMTAASGDGAQVEVLVRWGLPTT